MRVRVHADKPLAAGLLTLGEGAAKPLVEGDGNAFETELVLSRDNSYRIELVLLAGRREVVLRGVLIETREVVEVLNCGNRLWRRNRRLQACSLFRWHGFAESWHCTNQDGSFRPAFNPTMHR